MQTDSLSMTERVARALSKSLGGTDWRDYIDAARAAILALREPTPAMLDAATTSVVDWGYLPDDWRAMIDHAAREQVFPRSLERLELTSSGR